MKLRAYITHKNAERYSDCADYFGICPQSKRVAVSDGVSQSIMPLEWAQILVKAYLEEEWDPCMDIQPQKKKWLHEAESYLEEQKRLGKNPWMLENCLRNQDGAGATFCGISFECGNKWKASILGDSCLVVIDDKNCIIDIMSSKEGVFDNRPDYFDSFKERCGNVKTYEGTLHEKQKMFLVSDPFSELLQKVQKTAEEQIVIEELLRIENYNQYLELVENFRKFYHMHNDDSTLVVIEHDGNDELNIVDEETLDNLIEKERLQEEKEAEKRRIELLEEDELWKSAMAEKTKTSFERYIKETKFGKYKKEADNFIHELIQNEQELNDWNNALNDNTATSFDAYLKKYPKGIYTNVAIAKIKEFNLRSSEGGKTEEISEPSSEDSDSCGQGKRLIETEKELVTDPLGLDKRILSQQSVSNPATEEVSSTSPNELSAENKLRVASEESAAKDSGTANAWSTEAIASAQSAESNSGSTSAKTSEESKNDTKGTTLSRNSKYQEKVDVRQSADSVDEIRLPSNIDATDGIDRKEFKDLLPTAQSLFAKHTPFFKKAFDEPGWRNKPQECFKNFWSELETIIYNSHG